MKQFKCRASKGGTLLTNDRSGKAMGETAKSYCKEWLISEITGKEKDVKSKYLSRGNAMEEVAIERASKYYGCEFVKNEINLENEYFTGAYDAKNLERVIDTKVPFDAFTFPFFVTTPDTDYYAQLQIYMNLTGLKKASLCYCLENGSDEQIQKLSWDISRELGKDEPDIEDWGMAEKQLSYDHFPDNLRIKVFEFEYDKAFIEQLEIRVLQARKYIETELLTQIKL
jgi:hypothetical protein